MDSKLSAYSLLQKLESSRSISERRRFSRQLMDLLKKRLAPVDFVIKSLIEQSLGAYPFVREIQRQGAWETSYRSYIDDDELLKLAFGVSYMPDHKIYADMDDIRLIKHILATIKKKNLDLIVNDISVNFLQVRNGDTTELDKNE